MDNPIEKLRTEERMKREEERKRLLSIPEEQSYHLPIADRYQRMRYLREIEAIENIRKLNNSDNPLPKKTYIEYRTD